LNALSERHHTTRLSNNTRMPSPKSIVEMFMFDGCNNVSCADTALIDAVFKELGPELFERPDANTIRVRHSKLAVVADMRRRIKKHVSRYN
jgi:hypothetical protein